MTAAPSRAYAVISGGGTGGHVYPALALADELVSRGHPRGEIHFVGARRGLEATVVPAAGYAIDLLPGRGLRRSLRPRAWIANARTLVDTAAAVVRAARLIRQIRPRVVVGVGGYASFPTLVAAWALRVPRVVHEQNASPGLTNRLAVLLGARPAVTFPGTRLRGAVETGYPVRPAVANVTRRPGPGPAAVAVVGGSLGARRVNDAALELYARWRDRVDVTIHHVTGARDYERCMHRLAELRDGRDTLRYEAVAFEDHMERVYAASTVMVSRAGAGLVAELAAVGMPAVLVPLPGAPGDHQGTNARAAAVTGGAVVVPDADADGARLAAELDALLGDPQRLGAMSTAMRSLARRDGTAGLADLVERVQREAGRGAG